MFDAGETRACTLIEADLKQRVRDFVGKITVCLFVCLPYAHRCLVNYLLPIYSCLLCLLVHPVYHPSKRVYVYLLLFTTMVNVL
jgi:hypothetical protein